MALTQEFQKLVGQNTRQIGRYYCIPAVVSNALRVLGGSDFTQEKIRDLWYAEHHRQVEPNPDHQMTGAGPDVIETLKKTTAFSGRFDSKSFDLPKAGSFFDSGKADQALDFIHQNSSQGHPVLVSTDAITWEQGIITRLCCHMWLILETNMTSNMAMAHDPGNDSLFQIPIQRAVQVSGNVLPLEIGLRGRLTTSNYFCAAFWKK